MLENGVHGQPFRPRERGAAPINSLAETIKRATAARCICRAALGRVFAGCLPLTGR